MVRLKHSRLRRADFKESRGWTSSRESNRDDLCEDCATIRDDPETGSMEKEAA
jgi:hypothetical protein